MLTAFLFLIASLVVIIFIIVKIFNPDTEQRLSTADILKRIDPEKEFNTGSLLLKIGPFIAGLGLVGWVSTEWWEYEELRFLILLGITLTLYLLVAFLQKFAKGNTSFMVLSEAVLLIASFFSIASLYTGNDLLIENSSSFILGAAEIFGIWFLINFGTAYLFKSNWVLSLNIMASIFWLTPYLNPNFNFSPLLGMNNTENYQNQYLFLLIPLIAVIISTLTYTWHQKMNHQLPKSGYRTFYYLSGLFSFFTAGALIFHSIDIYYKDFYNLDLRGHILHDAMFALTTLVIFSIDFVLKKNFKEYNVNYLAAIIIPLTGVISLLIFPNSIFTGFFFIEAAFVVWLLADYLRQKSYIAAPIFYAFNGVQLFALASNNDNFNWFKILVILGILVYASLVHYLNKPLQYYVLIAGMLTLIVKIIATGANFFLMLSAIGLTISLFGVFYTQNRNKILKHKKEILSKNTHIN